MSENYNLTEQEIETLKKVQGTDLWDEIVAAIKQKRGNQYPPDWGQKVIHNPEIDSAFKMTRFDSKDELLKYLGIDK